MNPAGDPLRTSVDWIYSGVWGVLVRWFRVPAEPPTLPVIGGRAPIATRPANGFLNYQRTLFVVGWVWPLIGTAAAVVALTFGLPVYGVLLALPIAAFVAAALVAGWIGVHLRFDTQWYVISDRSARIRRGVWIIDESTITFENVQDITVTQGPLQRLFGIADVVLETAGGQVSTSSHGHTSVASNKGHLQGVADAAALKELIAARVRASRSAGLGDDRAHHAPSSLGAAHVALLKQILAELRAASGRPPRSAATHDV